MWVVRACFGPSGNDTMGHQITGLLGCSRPCRPASELRPTLLVLALNNVEIPTEVAFVFATFNFRISTKRLYRTLIITTVDATAAV
jgi:hypothetical protein